MRQPLKQRASFRLSPEAREQLAALAEKRNQTQTAVMETLISDAANEADAYFAHAAAYHSWLSATLIAELVMKDVEGKGVERMARAGARAVDLYGSILKPPQALRDAARAKLEAGKFAPDQITVLRDVYRLLD